MFCILAVTSCLWFFLPQIAKIQLCDCSIVSVCFAVFDTVPGGAGFSLSRRNRWPEKGNEKSFILFQRLYGTTKKDPFFILFEGCL